uniref:Uncharacterized protein n=1 Tax=Arundo donax TaxID=35708 RepID=A0A0A9GC62_ARUDO
MFLIQISNLIELSHYRSISQTSRNFVTMKV